MFDRYLFQRTVFLTQNTWEEDVSIFQIHHLKLKWIQQVNVVCLSDVPKLLQKDDPVCHKNMSVEHVQMYDLNIGVHTYGCGVLTGGVLIQLYIKIFL